MKIIHETISAEEALKRYPLEVREKNVQERKQKALEAETIDVREWVKQYD